MSKKTKVALENEVAMLRRALAFYADPLLWSAERCHWAYTPAWGDAGRLARDCLLAPVGGDLERRAAAAEAERDEASRLLAIAEAPVREARRQLSAAIVERDEARSAAARWEREWRELTFWLRQVTATNDPREVERQLTEQSLRLRAAQEQALAAVRGCRTLARIVRGSERLLREERLIASGRPRRAVARSLRLARRRTADAHEAASDRLREERRAAARGKATRTQEDLSALEQEAMAWSAADRAHQDAQRAERAAREGGDG